MTRSQIRDGLLAVTLTALVLPVLVVAQPAPPPSPTFEDRARKKSTLDRESKEAADEYADILVELQSLVADYREYLAESDSPTIIKYRTKLDRLAANIDKHIYVKDRDKLVADLNQHVDDLEEIEDYIEDSEEVFPIRILKLVSSLRRDLSNMHDLLDDDLVDRLAEVRANQDALQAEIEGLLAQVRIERRGENVVVTIPEIDEKKIEALQREAEVMARQAEKDAARAKKSVKVKTPAAPSAPVVLNFDHTNNALSWGGSGTTKEIEDTLTVTNPRLPIRIQSQLGEVTVTGSASKQIVARLSAEIAADSRTQEKKLLADIDLRLEAVPGGYQIVATAPMQGRSGENCRIISNQLEIMVPSSNPIELNSAFGSVTVRDLNSGLKVSSEYSQIDVEEVKGGVQLSSNMAGISMVSCSGPIRVKNAYAPIAMEACAGDLDVENAYADISLEGCSGNSVVRNSGNIHVTEHTGDMRISNSFGPVEVDGLSGNLSAVNQFSPVTVKDIKGTVSVENANANIDLTNVSGRLNAVNKFGTISAEDLAGPVNLANQNGNIFLVLSDGFKGNSWVSATFGNVDVVIPEASNFLVKAKTTFGDIVSDIPLKLDDMGTAKSGWFKLGRASDSLSINGQNTVIRINGSK